MKKITPSPAIAAPNVGQLAFSSDSKLVEALLKKPLDDEIMLLVSRFGEDSVKAAVKRVARPKIGRKPEPDMLSLQSVIEKDTSDILAERVPFATSDYAATVAIAREHRGHSEIATQKRLAKKLTPIRRPLAYYAAVNAGRKSMPHATYFAIIQQAIEVVGHAKNSSTQQSVAKLLSFFLDEYEKQLAQFSKKTGKGPEGSMSFDQIEIEIRKNPFSLGSSSKNGGLAGLFGTFE